MQVQRDTKLLSDDHELQDAALLNRLDIRAALARYEGAERKLRIEIARQYPDITLSPSYIYEEGFHIWQLGLNALLPLLNKNTGLIEEARALREVEAAQFELLQANVLGNLEQAKARYFGAVEMLEQTRQQYATSQQQLQRMSRQFDQGYADRLELAYSKLENFQAMQNLISAEYTVQRAAAALEDALQQPLEFIDALPNDMEQINPPAPSEPSTQE
jgi:outer membrane protein, heavy metal efflux system